MNTYFVEYKDGTIRAIRSTKTLCKQNIFSILDFFIKENCEIENLHIFSLKKEKEMLEKYQKDGINEILLF